MIEKLKTLLWFAKRPAFWPHAVALIQRKFSKNFDRPEVRQAAANWASERAVPVEAALAAVGLDLEGRELPQIDTNLLEEGAALAKLSNVRMGGAGDLDLLYAATRLSNARSVIETGVAYGWSSLALLSGQADLSNARLISVDMPYPKMNNEEFVGIVVPSNLRKNWTLIREPDRNGIKKAILILNGAVDLVHYDSDKSYQGRNFGYPLLWNALRKGGIFISDDIQDNMAFREFVSKESATFAVTKSQGKYVGIVRKT